MKRAIITGTTGQDGSYLAEMMLHKGYEVHGVIRRACMINARRPDQLEEDPRKAVRILNWDLKVRFHALVRVMMDADLDLVRLERIFFRRMGRVLSTERGALSTGLSTGRQ